MGDIYPHVIRVQAVLPGISGLLEDRFINTFYFQTTDAEDPAEATYSAAHQKVVDFYNGSSGGFQSIASFMSPAILKTAGSCSTRQYDMGAPEPRVPRLTTWTLAAGAVNPLPNEVCVVLSHYAINNVAGQRGRFYIGPLGTNALTTESSRPDVIDQLRSALLQAAIRLTADDDLVEWVFISPSKPERPTKAGGTLPAEAHQIYRPTNAWVDDEWDTQRRRGIEARSRVTATLL